MNKPELGLSSVPGLPWQQGNQCAHSPLWSASSFGSITAAPVVRAVPKPAHGFVSLTPNRCRNSENRKKKERGRGKEQWKLQKSVFSRAAHDSCSALTLEPQLRSTTPSPSQGSQTIGGISLGCFMAELAAVCCPPAPAEQLTPERERKDRASIKELMREGWAEQGPGWLTVGFQCSPGNVATDYHACICRLRCRRHGPQYAWANGTAWRLNHCSFSIVSLCISSHGKDPFINFPPEDISGRLNWHHFWHTFFSVTSNSSLSCPSTSISGRLHATFLLVARPRSTSVSYVSTSVWEVGAVTPAHWTKQTQQDISQLCHTQLQAQPDKC